MKVFNNFIDIKIKNDMGITGITDEFFCVYLNNLFKKYDKNILVVVDTLNEANSLYSSLSAIKHTAVFFGLFVFIRADKDVYTQILSSCP